MPDIDRFQQRLAERWVAMSGTEAAFHAASKAGEAASMGQEHRRQWWLGVLCHIETLRETEGLEFTDA